MIPAALPRFEARRQQAVDALAPLLPLHDARLGCIVRLAQRWFATDVCAVTLSDREVQRFVARSGGDIAEVPREAAFCAHVVASRAPLVVPDLRLDRRFRDHPFVLGESQLRFYAGAPLFSQDGQVLGTLCLLHSQPRPFGAADLQALQDHALLAQGELDRLARARQDETTGLPTLAVFEALAAARIEDARRQGQPEALALFDLAGMTRINADFGRAAGDRAIADFAQALRTAFHGSDALLGRLRGDAFAVLLRGADAAQWSRHLMRLRVETDRLNDSPQQSYELRFGWGQADVRLNDGGDVLRQALSRADEQLCARKVRPLAARASSGEATPVRVSPGWLPLAGLCWGTDRG